jgi:ribosomal protein S12 methylthiotransferase accessory factor YcaO
LTRPELLGDPGAVVRGATWEATPRARPLSEICPHRGPNRPSVDATGFAFGWTHAHAVQAATLELIERLLVGEVWYGDRRLLEVALDAPAVPAFEVPAPDLRVYVDGSSASLPLAIVAIHDAAAGIMVAGSDVKLSAPAAIEHALEEAVMLFESVHAGHAPSYESANARARYAMLEGRLTHKRAAFLRAKSTPGDVSGRVWPLDAIVDAVHGRDIEIYSLAEGTDFEVVRAIAPQWRLLIDRRADDDRHLLDPFC